MRGCAHHQFPPARKHANHACCVFDRSGRNLERIQICGGEGVSFFQLRRRYVHRIGGASRRCAVATFGHLLFSKLPQVFPPRLELLGSKTKQYHVILFSENSRSIR